MESYTISWIVVLTLGTLITLFFTIGKPILKLNQTMTELITEMRYIKLDNEANKQEHKEINTRINNVDKELQTVTHDVNNLKHHILKN